MTLMISSSSSKATNVSIEEFLMGVQRTLGTVVRKLESVDQRLLRVEADVEELKELKELKNRNGTSVSKIPNPTSGSSSFVQSVPFENQRALKAAANPFDSFDPNFNVSNGVILRRMLDDAKTSCAAFLSENCPPSMALFFGGKAGSGKTTIAAAIGAYMEMQGKRVRFVRPSDIFSEFLEKTGLAEADRYKSADVFVLDDFNGAKGGIEQEFLSGLIQYAHESGGIMIVFTSNMDYEHMVSRTFPPMSISRDARGNVVFKSDMATYDTERLERRIHTLFGNGEHAHWVEGGRG